MTQSLPDAIATFKPELPLAVAFSGGADSTALLLACARQWPDQVAAIHVHHGLQAAADDFERHCIAQCLRWQIPLIVQHIDARHARGDSPENAARNARYRAIGQAVRAADGTVRYPSVALAQHADDQVETLLLALSRGAGLPGLAAMPARRMRDGIAYHRPLLDVSAPAIRAWLLEQGVVHMEDPSNGDERLTRNRIRVRLMPVLAQVFPQFRDTFTRSARHAAQAQWVLDVVAAQDLLQIAVADMALSLVALQAVPEARQANLLRHWLRSVFGVNASAAQLAELQAQIAACTTRGHQIFIKVASGVVVRKGPHLSWYNDRPDPTLTG